jgi:DNA-binding NtrC family response regulator
MATRTAVAARVAGVTDPATGERYPGVHACLSFRHTAHVSPVTTLALLGWSDSFETLWPQLATASDAALQMYAADAAGLAAWAAHSDAIHLLAAGGAEHDAIDALERIEVAAHTAIVGATADHRLAVSAMRSGAQEYFALPGDLEALRSWVSDAAARLHGHRDGSAFASREGLKYTFDGILGSSPALASALTRASRVIPHGNVTVLLQGETGTGKELFARAIHYNGPRAKQPFVDVNCTAIPENLLESELFGHEAGAFTDARTAKPGLFELANGGTLFLDEIGHLPLSLQGKLLRVLEERTLRRVGGTRTIPFDVRVIAATHVRLQDAVAQGAFREDLWYRLNVMPIDLPPLRDRADDVVGLAQAFVIKFAREYAMSPAPQLAPSAQRALVERNWPGNVRELRNVIERALLLSDGVRLEAADLAVDGATVAAGSAGGELPWPASLSALARGAASAMLQRCGGNKSEAARRLGISRPRLQRLLDAPIPGESGDDFSGEF